MTSRGKKSDNSTSRQYGTSMEHEHALLVERQRQHLIETKMLNRLRCIPGSWDTDDRFAVAGNFEIGKS